MKFPDIDYGNEYPADGSEKGNKQVLWSKNYIITTELHEEGRIERTIDLGSFNFNQDILSPEGSTWEYRAEFTYRPEVSFIKWGDPPYIDNGYGSESNYKIIDDEVESGLIYKYGKGTAYPQWDPENNRKVQVSYSSSCNFDHLNNQTVCESYDNQNEISTTNVRVETEKILDKYLEKNWWRDPWSLSKTLTKEKNKPTG